MKKRGTKKRSGVNRLKWTMVTLALLAGLFGIGFTRETLRSRQIDNEITKLRNEAMSLRARNFEIARLRASLDDEDFLEREARVKLGFKKSGEEVVILKRDDPSESIQRVPGYEDGALANWSFTKKWWMYFADRRSYDDYAIRKGFR